ncbi:MAG: HNH endonuclease [Eubacteriaceae bacterium]
MKSKNIEEWKDIKNYKVHYQVNKKGEVRYKKEDDGKWLAKSQKVKKGYYKVRFSKKDVSVHRLVANAFIENPDNKETVDHKDGNKLCNCVENLRWLTQKENNQAYEDSKKIKSDLIKPEEFRDCK